MPHSPENPARFPFSVYTSETQEEAKQIGQWLLLLFCYSCLSEPFHALTGSGSLTVRSLPFQKAGFSAVPPLPPRDPKRSPEEG